MRIPGRLRLTLLAAMALVAVAAVFFGWVAAERRKQVATLTVEYRRSEDRVRWALGMRRSGYLSKAQVAAEKESLGRVQSQLEMLGAAPKGQ